jgi:hypothetical protein
MAADHSNAWCNLANADGSFSLRESAAILGVDDAAELSRRLVCLGLVSKAGRVYAAHREHVLLRPQFQPSKQRAGDMVRATPQIRLTSSGLKLLGACELAIPPHPDDIASPRPPTLTLMQGGLS